MGDRISRAVRAIQSLFESLSIHVGEERVVRHIVNELHRGRTFDDVLNDPYVVNNTSDAMRSHLLENPEILANIEDEIAKEFSDYTHKIKRS